MTNKSLYEVLNMKSKNSVLKSVFVTNKKSYEGYKIVEVEPYDDTFLNATSCISKYDKTVDRIMTKVYEYFKGQDIWLAIYTDNFGSTEILVNEFYMKQSGLLK